MMLPHSEPAACRAFFGNGKRSVTRLPSGGFSGSEILLVEHLDPAAAVEPARWVVKSFVRGTSISHALWVHGLISHLRLRGVEVVPALRRVLRDRGLPEGLPVAATVVEDPGGLLWEAVEFLPGRAVATPDATSRAEAMRCLAAIHVAAATLPHGLPRRMPSRGLAERIERAATLRARPWRHRWRGDFGQAGSRGRGDSLARLIDEAIEFFSQGGHAALGRIIRTPAIETPCQAVLRDIWSDHVLFEHGRVSGVIDFHAAGIDTVATDLARLVGSWKLASGGSLSRAAWEHCLAAYESIRPLHDAERRLVRFLHHAGVIVAIDNWFGWLVEEQRTFLDLDAVSDRLENLVAALPESIDELVRL